MLFGENMLKKFISNIIEKSLDNYLKNLNINSSLNGLKIETYFNKEIESLINNVLNKYELIKDYGMNDLKEISYRANATKSGFDLWIYLDRSVS